jgi:hypothetical protein
VNIGLPLYEGDEPHEDPDEHGEEQPVQVPTVEPVPVPA